MRRDRAGGAKDRRTGGGSCGGVDDPQQQSAGSSFPRGPADGGVAAGGAVNADDERAPTHVASRLNTDSPTIPTIPTTVNHRTSAPDRRHHRPRRSGRGLPRPRPPLAGPAVRAALSPHSPSSGPAVHPRDEVGTAWRPPHSTRSFRRQRPPYDLELGTMHTYFAKRLSKTWGLSVMPWLRYVRASAVPLGVALVG